MTVCSPRTSALTEFVTRKRRLTVASATSCATAPASSYEVPTSQYVGVTPCIRMVGSVSSAMQNVESVTVTDNNRLREQTDTCRNARRAVAHLGPRVSNGTCIVAKHACSLLGLRLVCGLGARCLDTALAEGTGTARNNRRHRRGACAIHSEESARHRGTGRCTPHNSRVGANATQLACRLSCAVLVRARRAGRHISSNTKRS